MLLLQSMLSCSSLRLFEDFIKLVVQLIVINTLRYHSVACLSIYMVWLDFLQLISMIGACSILIWFPYTLNLTYDNYVSCLFSAFVIAGFLLLLHCSLTGTTWVQCNKPWIILHLRRHHDMSQSKLMTPGFDGAVTGIRLDSHAGATTWNMR